ncbi:uncharacterized protein LOC143446398 isoform X1 [Clavelina lepadiformis]|uniref:uncharacterized protein LOC143446398 isoform X1 n=1 Tax=Clavelina lepadiformis TaxID=159417 RepID=UPI0040436093
MFTVTLLSNVFLVAVVMTWAESRMVMAAPDTAPGLESLNCSRISDDVTSQSVQSGLPFTFEFPASIQAPFLYDDYPEQSHNDSYVYYQGGDNFSFSNGLRFMVLDLDKNLLLFNESYTDEGDVPSYMVDVIGENNSINYAVVVANSNGKCAAARIQLSIAPVENQTCEGSIETSKYVIDRKVERYDLTILDCEVPDRNQPHGNGGNYTYRWFHDCAGLPDNVVTSKAHELHIQNVDFGNSGVYTCAIEHNGEVVSYVHHRVCVKAPRLTAAQLRVQCSTDRIFAKIGSTAVLECHGSLPGVNTSPIFVNVSWKKKIDDGEYDGGHSMTCKNIWSDSALSEDDTNVKCSYDIEDVPCLSRSPSAEEQKSRAIQIKMRMFIEDVHESDFGAYEVTLSTLGRDSSSSGMVTLMKNEIPRLSNNAAVFASCLGALVFLLVAAASILLLYRHRAKIQRLSRKATREQEPVTETMSI